MQPVNPSHTGIGTHEGFTIHVPDRHTSCEITTPYVEHYEAVTGHRLYFWNNQMNLAVLPEYNLFQTQKGNS